MIKNSLGKKENKMPHKSLRERAEKAIKRFGAVDIRTTMEEISSMSTCEHCGKINNMDKKLLLNISVANICDFCGKNINKNFVFFNPNIEFNNLIRVAETLGELEKFNLDKKVKEINKFLNPNRVEKNN